MSTSGRDAFLQRVRQALSASHQPGQSVPVEPRGRIGYQGAAPDPVSRFHDEFRAAGGYPHLVPDRAAATGKVLDLVQARSARRVLLGSSLLLNSLELPSQLRAQGVEVVSVDDLGHAEARAVFFAAEVGISGVDYLVAETGSLAVLARPNEPRSLTLLPPVHLAVAERSQILPDLFDLFAALGPGQDSLNGRPALTSCLSLITGPSKTGDIELKLVTGVHGPGEIHVVLITG